MLITNLFKYWTYQLFAPGTVLKEKYAAFKSLLTHDKRAHELMAELEEIYYHQRKMDFSAIESLCADLSRHVAGIVNDLSKVCPGCYPDLLLFYNKINAYIRFMTRPNRASSGPPFIISLEDAGANDLELVGGKALNLGIVKNSMGLPVPGGFVISTHAYRYFLEYNDLRQKIHERLAAIHIDDTQSLDKTATDIQILIDAATVPPDLATLITDHYRSLTRPKGLGVAMRSSAVGEDATASFAGQYLTVLNVKQKNLIESYKKIIMGKYSSEAISYRINYGLSDVDTPMAVLALNMVDAAVSGVLYTADVEAKESGPMKLHAVWGLGDLLVSGQAPADEVTLAKQAPFDILERKPAEKSRQVVCDKGGGLASMPLDRDKIETVSISDDAAKKLARWGALIEDHYQQPQDIEWAIDESQNIFILQSRPLHRTARVAQRLTCEFEDLSNDILLQGGECAASGIAAGVVFNTQQSPELNVVPKDAILVAGSALPIYAKVINRLNAIVTDVGSSAGHLASVAREFGVPALVNTRRATGILEHGRNVTVWADGKTVYEGTVREMLESPCARIDLIVDSPFMRKLQYVMNFVSTLDLVDPQDPAFTPQHCRSFHDIIRFAHEKAVQEMFHISDNRLRKLSLAKKLRSRVPMLFYVLDVGGGLKSDAVAQKDIGIQDVQNKAMHALWKGLTHPGIQWGAFSHFDWEAHDRMVMSGGIASPASTMFASHAVISDDYMNLNLRFGYHFVIVDALCAEGSGDNTLLFRFSGGGADIDQRMLRADFLSAILRRLGFDVTVKSDLVDGRYTGRDPEAVLQALDMIGRLLGATRLMDMYLKDADMIEGFVDDFMQGRYHFATTDL